MHFYWKRVPKQAAAIEKVQFLVDDFQASLGVVSHNIKG